MSDRKPFVVWETKHIGPGAARVVRVIEPSTSERPCKAEIWELDAMGVPRWVTPPSESEVADILSEALAAFADHA